jgi:hypothetical protein
MRDDQPPSDAYNVTAGANLSIIFAESGSASYECDYLASGDGLVTSLTLRLANTGNLPATNIQIKFLFPYPPFRFFPPMSYQSPRSLPDDYWQFSSDKSGPVVTFNGRGDFTCLPGMPLDLTEIHLTVKPAMAGHLYEIAYELASLQTRPKTDVLTVRVRSEPRG